MLQSNKYDLYAFIAQILVCPMLQSNVDLGVERSEKMLDKFQLFYEKGYCSSQQCNRIPLL